MTTKRVDPMERDYNEYLTSKVRKKITSNLSRGYKELIFFEKGILQNHTAIQVQGDNFPIYINR
uniref:Putative ovule protein n=1 Tax=Solanum chacoense TaxID=4108 RepID=A0A0V0HJ90_SOLCH